MVILEATEKTPAPCTFETGMSATIAKLQEEINQLRRPNQTGASERSVVFVSRDRKINKFAGSGVNRGEELDDFIDEVREILEVRRLSGKQGADFILANIEGPGKEEVKLRPGSEGDNPEKIFAILVEAFGERRSLLRVLRLFYKRKQRKGESLRGFSQALSELWKRITSRDPNAVLNRDHALHDQFCASVRD